jgi:membrane protein YqaA with SNARE-associated domain
MRELVSRSRLIASGMMDPKTRRRDTEVDFLRAMELDGLTNIWLWLGVIAISVTGSLVNLSTYYVARRGKASASKRSSKVDDEQQNRALMWYQRYGAKMSFFSFVPGMGVPLSVAAGLSRLHVQSFMLWVFAGKLFRNALVFGVLDVILELMGII